MRQRAMPRSSGWYSPCPPCSASRSRPATPRSAAPYCTYVGTSAARTRITRSPGRLVPMMSLRDFSGSSEGAMPAAASRGTVSSKMRPLASARVIIAALSRHTLDARAELAKARLDPLVAAVQVVDAIDHRPAFGDEAGDDEARRRPQVGRPDVRAGERIRALHHGRVALDVDVRAEAAQLLHVHEAVLEDGLG